MKKLLPILLLTACTTATGVELPTDTNDLPGQFEQRSEASSSEAAAQTIHQLPEELTIEYFSDMWLEGNDLELTKVLADNNAYTRYEIRYTSNGLTISGILNIPKGDGPFPLVIFNHGHIPPSIYTIGRGLKREQDYLARQGFAVLHTDYRGHGASDPSPDTKEIYDASLEYTMDSINAIYAVKNSTLPEVASIDTNRIGMLGHSLGGGITLNVAVARPDMIDAAVLYAPVSGEAWKNFDRWRSERPEGDNTRAAFGERGSSAWQALSSIEYLDNIDDPILVFHGTSDDDVPIDWSYELQTRMNEAGKDMELVVYDPEEHEFIREFDDFMAQTADFLRIHLKDPQTERGEPVSVIDIERMTKKPFGKYVTPQNSPVSPERFTGYHVGADFEVFSSEDPHNLVVEAICDGEIIYKGDVNGYGGVLIQSCVHNDNPVTVLYGHIWLDSVDLHIGDRVTEGDFIANLGEGHSSETDGERAHLHLGVSRGEGVELKGYANSAEAAFDGWIDPLELL